MNPTLATFAICFLAFTRSAASAQAPAQQIGIVLDDWHQAASVADEDRYFGHFAPNGVFMGTDATERWTVAQFREWAKPRFQRKATWSFHARDRHIDFSADHKTAWFDEILDTPNLGLCRGSGVLVLQGGEWKIAQYSLSVPIPNALVDGVVKQIRSQ
jgi:zona occludens toxin (predicted ATPase)